MKKAVAARLRCVAPLLLLVVAAPAWAQPTAQSAATVSATGSFANNGSFAGTVTINRFEQRGSQIVAVAIVQGTLSRANRTIGTAVAAEVSWPVRVAVRGSLLANTTSGEGPRIVNASWRAARVQAQGCTPLQVSLGATNVDLLGLQVALDPVGLTLTGAARTPLGDLVCAASDLLGNVAGLVNLLNSLLGVVTGLLGGLTGGLAGIGG